MRCPSSALGAAGEQGPGPVYPALGFCPRGLPGGLPTSPPSSSGQRVRLQPCLTPWALQDSALTDAPPPAPPVPLFLKAPRKQVPASWAPRRRPRALRPCRPRRAPGTQCREGVTVGAGSAGAGAYVLASGLLVPLRGPGTPRAPHMGVWPVCCLAQPSGCVGTPAAQDHVSRGGQEPRGLAFTVGALAVVVPSLQRSFGPNPCRFCSSWLSEPRGQIKWLSLWLSVSREPGLGQADSGLPERLSRALHPLLLQPCPPGPLTQDTEGRTCSRQGPVGAPGPPLPPRLDVWRLPVGRRPPGPALPVPAQPLTLAWPGGL